jgi:hypothetical protein
VIGISNEEGCLIIKKAFRIALWIGRVNGDFGAMAHITSGKKQYGGSDFHRE